MCQPREKCDRCGRLTKLQNLILATFIYPDKPEENKLLCPKCYRVNKGIIIDKGIPIKKEG
jgi:hypothetical protein